jgi:REP element-mobilizing transposase RayT
VLAPAPLKPLRYLDIRQTCLHSNQPGRSTAALLARSFTQLGTGRYTPHAGRLRNFVGQSFWARGYFVSTVGRDEEVIRNYIRNQEQEDRRLEQMNLWR